MKHTGALNVDVYPVGALADIRRAWREWRVLGKTDQAKRLPGRIRRSWRRRSYWNGWLAEHGGHHHNAGRGLTQTAALRRAARLCVDHRPEETP